MELKKSSSISFPEWTAIWWRLISQNNSQTNILLRPSMLSKAWTEAIKVSPQIGKPNSLQENQNNNPHSDWPMCTRLQHTSQTMTHNQWQLRTTIKWAGNITSAISNSHPWSRSSRNLEMTPPDSHHILQHMLLENKLNPTCLHYCVVHHLPNSTICQQCALWSCPIHQWIKDLACSSKVIKSSIRVWKHRKFHGRGKLTLQ